MKEYISKLLEENPDLGEIFSELFSSFIKSKTSLKFMQTQAGEISIESLIQNIGINRQIAANEAFNSIVIQTVLSFFLTRLSVEEKAGLVEKLKVKLLEEKDLIEERLKQEESKLVVAQKPSKIITPG